MWFACEEVHPPQAFVRLQLVMVVTMGMVMMMVMVRRMVIVKRMITMVVVVVLLISRGDLRSIIEVDKETADPMTHCVWGAKTREVKERKEMSRSQEEGEESGRKKSK